MVNYDKEKITELDFKLLSAKYSSNELEEVLKKIDEDYPVQYAIGDVEFLGYKIKIDERVLIPRFETELLVDKLKKKIRENGFLDPVIADVCTGSGCIVIALFKDIPGSTCYGIDKSEDALLLAKENARENGTSIQFLKMDVLESIDVSFKCDILVSNPPYVKLDEKVSPNTKYEPSMALYPGVDDIIFYKKILEESKKFMKEKSIIAFEIGSEQGQTVYLEARKYYKDSKIFIEKDYAGYDRFVFILNGCE